MKWAKEPRRHKACDLAYILSGLGRAVSQPISSAAGGIRRAFPKIKLTGRTNPDNRCLKKNPV